jgi:protein-S-isoprenylcysteine O-methyltransferase Ste14
MSLRPTLELGMLNAWIFGIAFILLVYIPVLTFKDFNRKMGQGEHYGKTEVLMTVLCFILMIFPIVLPLKLGTALFYIGLIIFLLGLSITTLTIANAASTPLGKPFVNGVYRYSRNPGYLGQIMVFVGIGIASASWIYLVLSATLIVLTFLLISIEERMTLEKFGESYRQYMVRTPRWLGIPRVEKLK